MSKSKIKINKKSTNNDILFYPSINDKKFYENIYKKKEFYKNRIPKETRTPEEICQPKEFQLMPNQEFLRNFISQDTPYNGILIYHGTGFGKTCSAISIAEGFKSELNKRILVILGSSIKRNFMKQIFNLEKEINKSNPNMKVQCTGDAYNISARNLTPRQKQHYVNELIKQYYQFIGPEQLSNYVMKKLTNWDGNPKTITPQIIKAIQREYSNRIIIIDEIQNIKTLDTEKEILKKRSPIIIETIIKYATNVRLILMSATPMFNNPREIVYILNLLLLNDGRPILKENQLFTKDDILTEKGTQLLLEYSRGYISYLTAKNPLVFPIKIYPNNANVPQNITHTSDGELIPSNDQIHISKLILLPMSELQYKTYQSILGPQGKIEGTGGKLTDTGNIIFPIANSTKVALGKKGFRDFSDGNGAFMIVRDSYLDPFTQKTKKTMYFRYQNHVILNKGKPNEKPFFDLDLISLVSPKFYSIINTIRKSKGISFVYSQNIWSGVLPLALALEQNGFQRYSFPGEAPSLLDYGVNNVNGGGKHRPICYLCGGDIKDVIHNRENKKFDHDFDIAKYVILTGEPDITNVDANDAATQVNKTSNMWGKNIKVILGTSVAGEGIDFQNIRQVHILEPWYNYSRLEQVIGRADRNCSHISLPEPERNVEIYQYAAFYPNNVSKKQRNIETIDLKNYRFAENKLIRTKRVEDVLRKGAVDCALNIDGNMHLINKDIPVYSSSGIRFVYNPYTKKNIDNIYSLDLPTVYECIWEPSQQFLKTMKVNTDTYNIRYAMSDIEKIEQYIYELYQRGNIYDLEAITNYVSKFMPLIEPKFVYKALDNIVNTNKLILDKYNRKGYIIYRGTYYIWQPNEIPYEKLPMYYRSTPLTLKTKNLILDELNIENKTVNAAVNLTEINKTDLVKYWEKLQNELQLLTNKLNAFIDNNFGKINEELTVVIIQYVLDRYNYEQLTELGFWLLEHAYNMKNIITKTITEYLINNRILIKNVKQLEDFTVLLSYNLQETSSISNIKSKLMPNKIYCYNKKTHVLEQCSDSVEQKIKYWLQQQSSLYMFNKLPNNIADIFGLIGLNRNKLMKKNDVDFKIIDKSKIKITKDKNNLPKGRICNTLTTQDSKNVQKVLGLKQNNKSDRKLLCVETEITLRYYQSINKNKKIWTITNMN